MLAVLEGQEWLVVAGVGLLFAAAVWLPELARSLSRSRREYRRGLLEGAPATEATLDVVELAPAAEQSPAGSPLAPTPPPLGAWAGGTAPVGSDAPDGAPLPMAPLPADRPGAGASAASRDGADADGPAADGPPHRGSVQEREVAPVPAAELLGASTGWAELLAGEGELLVGEGAGDPQGGAGPHEDGPGAAGAADAADDPHAAMWRRVDRLTGQRAEVPRALRRPRPPRPAPRRDATQP